MKQRVVQCPACGSPMKFELSVSLVKVCEFCQSVVARTDQRAEDHGKVAELVQTDSPLFCGLTGLFEKKRYEVIGRVQYRHPAGGVWNEWYLKFPENRVRWLAEAQGKWYLTVEKRLGEATQIPPFEELPVGHVFNLPGDAMLVVAEKGVATAISAEGEIPWSFRPRANHTFVDLHGPENEFATIEYDGGAPRLFLGREVSLREFDLNPDPLQIPEFQSANTGGLQINCPQCAGPLTLHAPDKTERVCCPSCKAFLDCDHGKLRYLQTLHAHGEQPLIPLGAVGTLFGVDYTVIGFMERYVIEEGQDYAWTEYLLYHPEQGFRWLVNSNRHWSFVEAVLVSQIVSLPNYRVTFRDRSYRLFERGRAFIRYVVGEFYWRVSIEDTVDTEDYIAPPNMLSFERSATDKGEELNVSLATYLERPILEAAFKLQPLPVPWGIGTMQPQPDRSEVWMMWLGFLVTLIGMYGVFFYGGFSPSVSPFHLYVALTGVSLLPIVLFLIRHQTEVSRWRYSAFSPYSSGSEDDE